ncbi:hypothetical protein F4678DRAFT_412746 [Xylaria arbuscula]|nr:hypothetical protein F4678DRAFT_412746 [Xylaria arbuscula]
MAEFHGQGVQNTGKFIVGRDLNISTASRDSSTLLKVRSTDPRDDKARIEQQKGGLLRDSYKWILSHEDFLKWRDGEGYQLLWVRGDPGKGKTMLLCGIIDELDATRRDRWNIAYFFCQGTNYQLRKASFVLQGLIFSLLSQEPGLLDCVREDIDQASGEMFRDLNGWAALCRILGRLIEESERRRLITYLIIDALDECLEDRHHLMKWIASLSSPGIKVLISSRNWPLIEDGLSSATHKVLLHLELNDESISDAVKRYIDYQVMGLERSKGLTTEAREAIRQYLMSYSKNTFLWVALVCEQLGHEGTHPWEILDMAHEFPPGLDELYERMAAHFQNSKDTGLCRHVLSIQTLAYRPLTLAEFSSLAELPKEYAESWLHRIVGLCGSFLTIRSNTIYFIHQSAKDYLIKRMSHFLFPEGLLAAGHRTMVQQSIQVLAGTLRENMYQLPSPGSHLDDHHVPDPDPLRGIRYACVYWADHLVDAELIEKRRVEDGALVYQFLEKHLLHWFEALSLFKSLGSGIKALTKILSLQKASTGGPSSGSMQVLQDLVYDAWRFLRRHKVGIETAPLQVYSSALIFSPTHSLVRQMFWKNLEWLAMTLTESHWSLCLQTLEGHQERTMSVAFAPNAKYVASGSDDCTVRVWDVTAGECLNVLNGHEGSIRSIAFSPNSECLASSSADHTVRIWDTLTGVCLRTFRYDLTDADDMRCDGVVAFLGDRDVVLIHDLPLYYHSVVVCSWNIETGECHKLMERVGHAESISRILESLSLSGSGTRAAWIRRDPEGDRRGKMRIEVIDTVAGRYHQNPWYRQIDVNDGVTLALSFDGKYLAMTGDTKSQSFLWDLATNECTTLEIPSGSSRAMAFLPSNGYLVGIAWGGDGLWVYNIATTHLQPIKLSSSGTSVCAMAFSPDSSLWLIGDFSGAVRVLEMAAHRLQLGNPALHHSGTKDTLCPIILSPDGTLLGIMDQDHDLQIWDVAKNERMSTIPKRHPREAVKFSPENKYLACTLCPQSRSNLLPVTDLYDAATGRHLWKVSRAKLEEHSKVCKFCYPIDFSADGSRVALTSPTSSVSPDVEIQIREVATGKCLSTVAASSFLINTFALSCDGTKLATISASPPNADDSVSCVHIWDIASEASRLVFLDRPLKPDWHNMLTFSPNDRYITLGSLVSEDGYIVDAITGTLFKDLVGFGEPAWGIAGLQTDRGVFGVQALVNDPGNRIEYRRSEPNKLLSGVGISSARDWILKDGKPYLWLPIENRPENRVFGLQRSIRVYDGLTVAGNTVVIGDTPDQIYCIRSI